LTVVQRNERRNLHEGHAFRRAEGLLFLLAVTLTGLLLATRYGGPIDMGLGAVGS
jgi:uncharacterized protein YybS (DUF2232 family)